MPKGRVSASSNSPSFQQLWEALGSKLIEAAQGNLLPKQRVVSSNLITRSSLENRGCLEENPLSFHQGKESSPELSTTDIILVMGFFCNFCDVGVIRL